MISGENTEGSVTKWIQELQDENSEAREKIWKRFINQLVGVANRVLRDSTCRIATGETVAVDAFVDFFNCSPEQFQRLIDRNDLWKILRVIAERRAIDEIRREIAVKRGGDRKVVNEDSQGMVVFPGNTAPPDVELMLIEAFDQRLQSLDDPILCQIALEKMNGLTNEEIAAKISISVRGVERKLNLIRRRWTQDLEDEH